MKKRIFAVAMALCLLTGASAFAQDSKQAPAKEKMTVEQIAQKKTDRMKAKLQLNDEQTKQIYAYNLEQVKQMQAQREQMRMARKADAEKMKGILTPEQFKQWKEMQGPEYGHARKMMGKQGKECPGKRCDKPRSRK